MAQLLLVIFFLLGMIIGGFLNVVVLRYGTKKKNGRSMCFSCGKTLRWFELVPMLSFLVQGGRCRGCKSQISWQYISVELLTGLVFALVFWKNSFLLVSGYSVIQLLVIGCEFLLWSLLIALSVYDIKHKIIPEALVYSACFVSLLVLLLSYRETYNLQLTTYNFFSGFFFAIPFALLWFFSRGQAMGLGDAKLMLLFPWLLGLAKGLSALIIGFWIGAAVGLSALLLKMFVVHMPRSLYPNLRSKLRRVTMKSELPFGPFLVLGLFLVYLFGWDVTGLSLLLQNS